MADRTTIARRRRKVWELSTQGYGPNEIASKLGVHKNTIFRDRRYAPKGQRQIIVISDPKDPKDLSPEIQKRLEFSPEGFERFFNYYSSYRDLEGNRSPLQPHSKRFVRMAIGQRRVLLNVPPAHGKSSIFSVWMVIWLICMDRNNQILLLSKTQGQAMKFCREIAHHLENNPKLLEDFDRFVPEKGEGVWSPGTGQLMVVGRQRDETTGDLTLLARGAGQGIYGLRATWIIGDDLVTTVNSQTQDQREKLSDWFHVEVMSRLEPGCRSVIIGTRFHLDDLYGELSRETERENDPTSERLWTHINFPALADAETGHATNDWENGVPLWPNRWTTEELRYIFNSIGPARWDQTYQQQAIPSGSRLVQPDWIYGGIDPLTDQPFRGCLDRDRIVGGGGKGVRVISVDPSPSKYAAMIVADVLYRGEEDWTCTVLEVVRRRMAVRDMLDELDRLTINYKPRDLIIEVNAAQKWFAQDSDFLSWQRENNVGLIPHSTGKNKADEDMGVESLEKDFYFGRIRLPYGDAESVRQSELLAIEALNYIPGSPKGSSTDDVLMALWFIKWNRKKLRRRLLGGDDEVPRGFHLPRRLRRSP